MRTPSFKSAFLALAAIGAMTAVSQPASAYVLNNDNGGDGYVVTTPGGFDLFGGNNNVSNTTTYTQVAGSNETLDFKYTYTTNDCCGSYWDPAGYVVNGNYTQLSPATSAAGYTQTGNIAFNVLAGQSYGFYVYTVDGELGRGDIAVSSVPLPAGLPMFIAGLLGVFGFSQFNRKKAFAA